MMDVCLTIKAEINKSEFIVITWRNLDYGAMYDYQVSIRHRH